MDIYIFNNKHCNPWVISPMIVKYIYRLKNKIQLSKSEDLVLCLEIHVWISTHLARRKEVQAAVLNGRLYRGRWVGHPAKSGLL